MVFDQLFTRFKKKPVNAVLKTDELEAEFRKAQIEYAKIADSDIYAFLREYFLAKLEINRDQLEKLGVDNVENMVRFRECQAENKVYRSMMKDIESMKEIVEIERLNSKLDSQE
jgi:hypothetical protein